MIAAASVGVVAFSAAMTTGLTALFGFQVASWIMPVGFVSIGVTWLAIREALGKLSRGPDSGKSDPGLARGLDTGAIILVCSVAGMMLPSALAARFGPAFSGSIFFIILLAGLVVGGRRWWLRANSPGKNSLPHGVSVWDRELDG